MTCSTCGWEDVRSKRNKHNAAKYKQNRHHSQRWAENTWRDLRTGVIMAPGAVRNWPTRAEDVQIKLHRQMLRENGSLDVKPSGPIRILN